MYFYGMIPQDTVNQILQAAEISEVVGEFVNLKKRGANLIACCPFHNEKTPSFSVSPAKGIYKCFGCGKGGDSVRFIMDLEGFSYPDALKWLAKKYNIEVKEKEFTDTELAAQNERESLFIVSEFAEKYFREVLLNTDEGQSIGGSYFTERGFSKPMLERFRLGYAPEGRDDFYQTALKAGFSAEVLEKAGLVKKEKRSTTHLCHLDASPVESAAALIKFLEQYLVPSEGDTSYTQDSEEIDSQGKNKQAA